MPSYQNCVQWLSGTLRTISDGRLVLNKRYAKRIVSERGYRVPQSLDTSLVVKPDDRHSCEGVVVIRDGQVVMGTGDIVEEAIIDENGQCPPRDFKVFCFDNTPLAVRVVNRIANTHTFFDPYTWKQTDYEHPRFKNERHDWPAHLETMISMAADLSTLFVNPVRVDLYCSEAGPVFGEFCLTHGHPLSSDADRLFGEKWLEHRRKRGIC